MLKGWQKKKDGIVTINEPLEKPEPVAKPEAKVKKMWMSPLSVTK